MIASLGASLSIVVAGSLALMTVSTVVAFQGWPGIAGARDAAQSGQLATVDTGRHAAHRDRRAPLVVPRRRVTPRAKPHVAARHVTRRVVTPVAAPVAQRQAPPTHTATAPPPPPPASTVQASTPAPKRQPTAGDGVRKVGSSLGTSVSDTGQQLGDAVGHASPVLGTVVVKVSDVVARVLTSATDMIAKTLDLLTQARRP